MLGRLGLCLLRQSGVWKWAFELTLAVEGEAPGGVGLLGEVSHSPAAGIGTTGNKELAIYSLVTKDSQKLQLGSWLWMAYVRVA